MRGRASSRILSRTLRPGLAAALFLAAGGGTVRAAQTDAPGDRVFARLEIADPVIYVHENVPLTVNVYLHDLEPAGQFRIGHLPLAGLEFQNFRERKPDTELVDGKLYSVRRFETWLRALTAGQFRLAPTLSLQVRVARESSPAEDPEERLFATLGLEAETLEIHADPLVIDVRPLPEADRPASFSGAVGQFTFRAEAAPDRLTAGEPMTLTMNIGGTGNLDAVSAPHIAPCDGVKLYEARLVKKEVNDARTYGTKVFEQVMIPRSPGVTELPPVRFSYFDPESGQYLTIEQGPFRVGVAPDSNAVGHARAPPEPGRAAPVLEDDIVYLKQRPRSWQRTDRVPWYRRPEFLTAQGLPPALAVAVLLVARHRRRLTQDAEYARRLRAPRHAAAARREVRSALAARDNELFFEAVWTALHRYFADRLNLDPGDVDMDAVVRRFRHAGMGRDDLNSIRMVFELCEQARFGSGFSSQPSMTDSDCRNAEVIAEKLEAMIQQCEDVRGDP